MQALKQLFALLDKDGGDYVDTHELRSLSEALAKSYDRHDVEDLMRRLDGDHNGRLYYAEFRDTVIESVEKSFNRLDSDGDGILEEIELEAVAGVFKMDVKQLLYQSGSRERRMHRQEFVHWVVAQCVVGVKRGEFKAGLAELLMLKGPGSSHRRSGPGSTGRHSFKFQPAQNPQALCQHWPAER